MPILSNSVPGTRRQKETPPLLVVAGADTTSGLSLGRSLFLGFLALFRDDLGRFHIKLFRLFPGIRISRLIALLLILSLQLFVVAIIEWSHKLTPVRSGFWQRAICIGVVAAGFARRRDVFGARGFENVLRAPSPI